jgi:hypothetical protein
VQSRGPRLNDVLSTEDANEIANVPRGFTKPASQPKEGEKTEAEKAVSNIPGLERSVEEMEQEARGVSQSVAKVHKGGKVEIEEVGRTN